LPQVPFVARVCPEHWLLAILKEPGLLPPSTALSKSNVTLTVLGFENTMVFGVPTLPAATGERRRFRRFERHLDAVTATTAISGTPCQRGSMCIELQKTAR